MKTLEDIKNSIAEFSDRKFGANRPYTAPLHHLKKEVDEVIEKGEISEYADCLLLLLDSFRKKYPETHTDWLIENCRVKILVCENRDWCEPDENGVIEHVRN